jgi:integrase
MANGVEVRGNRVRVYFRYLGELCREPFNGAATPANIAQAERLVGVIEYEIKAGTFNYARHFPNSPKVKTNTLGHYMDLWLEIKRNEMAPSGFRTYKSKVETHIRPRWGDEQADAIDHLHLQEWVHKTLMPNLHNRTVREVVSLVKQIFTLYRARNRSAHDPTEGITIRQPDPDEVDPFDREEIDAILSTPTDKIQELHLAQFMIWTGPRVSEAIALAWEDVDLKAGTVRFRRGQVRGVYKVTKNRRSNREVRLLKPALQALMAQVIHTPRGPSQWKSRCSIATTRPGSGRRCTSYSIAAALALHTAALTCCSKDFGARTWQRPKCATGGRTTAATPTPASC